MTTFNFREPGEFGDGATMTQEAKGNVLTNERLIELLAQVKQTSGSFKFGLAEIASIASELISRRNDGTSGVVKAIDWVENQVAGGDRWYGNAAIPPHYQVHGGKWWRTDGGSLRYHCDSADEAKAAAQADFNARISSALAAPIQPVTNGWQDVQRAYDILCSGNPPHSARESNARRALRHALDALPSAPGATS